ncbi:MAG: CopD family protein [Pseudonocardia sp.]|nr:CopD family protein [Pseudonocardia sp.]
MTRPAARPDTTERLAPFVWTGLAVGAALLAAVAVGSLAGSAEVGALASRSAMDTAAVAAVGLSLTGILVPHTGRFARDGEAVVRRADRAILPVAGFWLVTTLVSILFRAADGYGRPVGTLTAGDIGLWATRLAAGRGLVLTALCALAVLGCVVARLRRPGSVPVRVLLVVALLGALTPAVTGHTGSSPDHQLAVVMVALHVGAAALWVGGLGAMLVLVARQRFLLERALPRFSRIATAGLVMAAITGVVNAALRLPGLGDLLSSGYGQLVIAKTLAIAVLGGLGGLARGRLRAGTVPVLRWAGLEVTLMAVTIGLAAALSQTAP